jgi:hypothetical protein
MKHHAWKTAGGVLFTVAAAAIGGGSTGAELGCSSDSSSSSSSSGSSSGSSSSSSGIGSIPGCTADDSLSCAAGSDGWTCDAGVNPESADPTATCSTPVSDSSGDHYCCFAGFTGTPDTCAQDDEITSVCPDPTSFGFVCASGDTPSNYDSSLSCSGSTPDADGVHDDFCCTYDDTSGSSSSGGGPVGCNPDATLDCAGSAVGYACAVGDNPETEDSTLACSTPTSSGSEDDYCCFTGFTGDASTCAQDDSLTAFCDYPSYGFVCASGDNPNTYDPTLTCSDSQPDPDGVHDDFCCTY